jgi:hypothetical protein
MFGADIPKWVFLQKQKYIYKKYGVFWLIIIWIYKHFNKNTIHRYSHAAKYRLCGYTFGYVKIGQHYQLFHPIFRLKMFEIFI